MVAGTYLVEVKGYWSDQWEAKYQSNQDVLVLGKAEMQPVLDYVTKTYGKDFIRLYETGKRGREADGACLESK